MKKAISVLLALLVLALCVVPAAAAEYEYTPETCPGHTWSWVLDQAPTCADGARHQVCSLCGATQNEGTIIPGTGNHNWVWIVDVPAGAVTAGTMHQVCSDCHAVQNMNTRIPAKYSNQSADNALLRLFDQFIAAVTSLVRQIQAIFDRAN